jgi:hypothetical protein
MVQKGVSYEVEEEWHNIKQNIAEVHEKMIDKKNQK